MWETIGGAFLGLFLGVPVSWYFYRREARDAERSHAEMKQYFDNLIAAMEAAQVASVVRDDAGRITGLRSLRSMPQVEGDAKSAEQQQSAPSEQSEKPDEHQEAKKTSWIKETISEKERQEHAAQIYNNITRLKSELDEKLRRLGPPPPGLQ